jgi:hypothetical protein
LRVSAHCGATAIGTNFAGPIHALQVNPCVDICPP